MKNNIQESAKIFNIEEDKFLKAAIVCPNLFIQKAETLKKNIQESATALGVSEETLLVKALDYPIIFCLKPESINKKNKAYLFYKKISGKSIKDELNVFSYKTEDFYMRTLYDFVIKELKITGKLAYAKLAETLKKHPDKTFSFDLPQDECTEEFIQYVKAFFAKNFGSENYKFLIEGKLVN